MGPENLQKVLAGILQIYGDRVLASWNGNEDAAVFDIDAERYGILTVDFITPVVDDPYTWGQVAAANALSDVFAIGGRPIVVLNTVCFPTKYRALDVLRKILEGGFERVRAAGTFLAGGYSVQDDEPKYGLVVYGEVEKSKLWRTTGAMAGDKLILTKPLGTGIAVTAIKADMIDMPRELHSAEVHAATDVTGFGLAGYVCDMLGGNLDCCVNLRDVPSITGVKELADMGLIPEGAYRNMAAFQDNVDAEDEFAQSDIDVIYDAQTSGGLLLAVSPEKSAEVLAHLMRKGFERSEIIGTFTAGTGKIKLVQS